ncbi:BLUF domain-containing protein [Engelhardtia mirabilis]
MHDQADELVHVIYSSAARVPFEAAELTALLARSRRRNGELGVTGMLLHVDGSFFQILEGPRESVRELFERIARDPRHAEVTTIIDEPIAGRAFGDWTMGFADLGSQDLAELPGLNDFFQACSCLAEIDSGRARKLARAFQQGRWRAGPTPLEPR